MASEQLLEKGVICWRVSEALLPGKAEHGPAGIVQGDGNGPSSSSTGGHVTSLAPLQDSGKG